MMRILLSYGSCGIAAGAAQVSAVLEASLPGLRIEKVGCNGMCFAEPLLQLIDERGNIRYYGNLDEIKASAWAEELRAGAVPQQFALEAEKLAFLRRQTRIALRNCGLIDPESLEAALAAGAYGGLRRALELGQQGVIEEIKLSGLRGRGGAGFPTWRKWQAALDSGGAQKYVICNADEGDPGAFMDRSLLEGDPHNMLEGMMIAGFAVGASAGIIYVRAEYPLAVRRLQIAIEQAQEAGYLGKNILGSGFDFEMRLAKGAGAFVCGEETALIASLEGERGMPKLKPPYPAQSGYKGQPSNINNVETYANVPWIISQGSGKFAALGSGDSKGTKVFALAGKVKFGGLIEIPMGVTLREIIYDIAGGIADNRPFKAVQIGGPSGGCLPASLLDTPVDYQSIGATGAIMGSGGMVVMDDTACMVDMAHFFMDFTAAESCGKCTPCRIGTQRMREILAAICAGQGEDSMIDQLQNLGTGIVAGALCGLGNSAPNPVLTTLRYFPEEYREHIEEKKCRALKCPALLQYSIDAAACSGCGLCALKCPAKAISGEKKQAHKIAMEKCLACGDCLDCCRFGAVLVNSGEVKSHA
jgi:NADH-quinone oxidoreductase subunit F